MVDVLLHEYCLDSWATGTFALMDEAVKKAEAKAKLDYIKDTPLTRSSGPVFVQLGGID